MAFGQSVWTATAAVAAMFMLGLGAEARVCASSRPKPLDRKRSRLPSYLVGAAMPELYRPPQRKPAGMSIARMVAVANAQTRSEPAFCEITSTLTTPMVEPACMVSARAMISSPSAGPRKLILISTVTASLPPGIAVVAAAPAAWSARAVITPPWKWPKNCVRSGRFLSAIVTLPGSSATTRKPDDFGKPGRSMTRSRIASRSVPLIRCASRRNANRQLFDAANKAGIDPLRLADHLDAVETLQHFVPHDLELQLGEPHADAAVDAEAERQMGARADAVDDEFLGLFDA